ncbi:hypothetical protein HY772_05790 [Candidatus Woesearchaeota archaeon]|nr:hypothetical protein [Candidatus Woesearchaeota archaeon]
MSPEDDCYMKIKPRYEPRYKKLKHVNKTLLMLFLILTLPIYSSLVIAATIQQPVGVYGSKQISGFMARTDTITINATVLSPEDPQLGPGQLKIVEDPTRAFDCKLEDPATSRSLCTHTRSQLTLPPGYGVVKFTLQLFSDADLPITTPVPGSIYVDELPPKVTSLSYLPLPGGIVTATYTIKDEACDAAVCSGVCSGLQSIRFTVSGINVGEEKELPAGCGATKTITLTIPVVGVEKKQICVEAKDLLDNTGQQCQQVTIDTKPPEVKSVALVNQNGKSIVSTNGLPISSARLIVNFSEDSITSAEALASTVYFDLSSINAQPAFAEAYKQYGGSQKVNCVGPSGSDKKTYMCSAGGLIVLLTGPTTISIGIEAKDNLNNSLKTTKTLSVLYEKDAPVPTKFYTEYVDDKGNNWVKPAFNDVKVDITESGSGLASAQVFADFSEFGVQEVVTGSSSSTVLLPNECKSGWTCAWKNIKTDKPSHARLNVRIIEPTQDDAGNHLTGPFVGTFFVDAKPPEVTKELSVLTNLTAIGEKHDPLPIMSTGDSVEVRVFVAEQSQLKKAVANFTALIDDPSAAEVEGECTENQVIADTKNRIYECVFKPEAPVIPGYIGPLSGKNDLRINFQFTDLVGFVGNYTYPEKGQKGLEVLAVENQSIQTWKYRLIDFSPSIGLDRLVWSLNPQRIYEHFKLEAVGGRNPRVLSLQLNPQDCKNLEFVNVDPTTNKYAVTLFDFPNYASQPEQATLEDIAVLEMNPASTPEVYTESKGVKRAVNEIWVNCTIRVTSIVKTFKKGSEKAITQPDLVNASFRIPVFNNPLGQNIGNMKERVAELQDDINRWDWLVTIRKIFEIAKAICSMLATLVQLNAIFGGIRDLFAGTCDTPAGAAAGQCDVSSTIGRYSVTQDNFAVELMYRLHEFCQLFIACRVSTPPNPTCKTAWCNIQRTWSGVNGWWANANDKVTNPKVGGAPLFSQADFDPQKSIVTSVMSACLPGIILNLDKYLQIQCKRLLCYKIDVPSGRPLWRCDKEYDFLMCQYFTGQVMNILPLFQYLDQLSNILADIGRQPLQLVGWVFDKACNLIFCQEPHTVGCAACRFLEWGTALTNIIADIVEGGIGDRFRAATKDICKEALRDNPNYENIGLPGPPQPAAG